MILTLKLKSYCFKCFPKVRLFNNFTLCIPKLKKEYRSFKNFKILWVFHLFFFLCASLLFFFSSFLPFCLPSCFPFFYRSFFLSIMGTKFMRKYPSDLTTFVMEVGGLPMAPLSFTCVILFCIYEGSFILALYIKVLALLQFKFILYIDPMILYDSGIYFSILPNMPTVQHFSAWTIFSGEIQGCNCLEYCRQSVLWEGNGAKTAPLPK